MKLKYSLKGLDCANCAQKVQERVSKLENVRECSVVFATTKMFVETDTDLFDESVEADFFPQEQKRMHTKSRSRKSLALKQFFM